MWQDPSVVQNYGSLLEQLVQTIPDGLAPRLQPAAAKTMASRAFLGSNGLIKGPFRFKER